MALSDAFSNSSPKDFIVGRMKFDLDACLATNVSLSGMAPAVIDGVAFSGFLADPQILLAGQSSAAENGIYKLSTVAGGLSGVTVPTALNGSGSAQITGLTNGVLYGILLDANTSVSNGTVTVAGGPSGNANPIYMAPNAGTLTITGTPSASLPFLLVSETNISRNTNYNELCELPPNLIIQVKAGTANAGRWVLRYSGSLTIGTTPLTLEKVIAQPKTP